MWQVKQFLIHVQKILTFLGLAMQVRSYSHSGAIKSRVEFTGEVQP